MTLIAKTAVFGLLAAALFGCADKSSVVNRSEAADLEPMPQPTRFVPDPAIQSEGAEVLCGRLSEIKKLPYRDPNDTDQIYEALMAKGKEAVPCLIEKITDETPMEDPREAQPWQQYKVGDTAVFILADIAVKVEPVEGEILQRMLPPVSAKEWETNGVYAYFNYVWESENRKELQKWWRRWATGHGIVIDTKFSVNAHPAKTSR